MIGSTRKEVRIATYIRNNIKFTKTTTNIFDYEGKIELIGIKIYLDSEELTLISCYRPPGYSRITTYLWCKFLHQFCEKVIMGGDFNAHHSYWGDKKLFNRHKIIG